MVHAFALELPWLSSCSEEPQDSHTPVTVTTRQATTTPDVSKKVFGARSIARGPFF